ncbi:MAG: fructose-6-phosphate aldolase [Holosporaceae bacterium]|jgi:transaldolase|nr:fructose-6-phosphate aldolase [Holosporaceae bacterium]
MELFLDTANLEEISLYGAFIDGITTNPTIMSRYAHNEHYSLVRKICGMVRGPVSVEVNSEDFEGMVQEGQKLATISNKVCVKLPCTFDGFMASKKLSAGGIPTNLTLCFSPTQALIAAKCGATYVSPFIGRLEDSGHDGILLLEEIAEIYQANEYETKILAASIRSVSHVVQAARIGVGAITLPPHVMQQCLEHPLTHKGMEIFSRNWENKK